MNSQLTRFRSFSRMNGLKMLNSILNKYELFTTWIDFKRSDSVSWKIWKHSNVSFLVRFFCGKITWTHWSTNAANDGVNCMIWFNDNPLKSKITAPPQIWVFGSNIEAAMVTWIARNRSFSEHFDGFHFSVSNLKKKKHLKFGEINREKLIHFYVRPHSIHKTREPLRSLTGISLTNSCSNTCLTLFGYKSSYKLACFCFNLKNVRICKIFEKKLKINILPHIMNHNNAGTYPFECTLWIKFARSQVHFEKLIIGWYVQILLG